MEYKYIAQLKLNTDVSYYESLPSGNYVFYVKNLGYDGTELVKAVEKSRYYKVYDYNKRKASDKDRWMTCNITSTQASETPKINSFCLNIGDKGVKCWFANYNKIDTSDPSSLEEMQYLVDNYLHFGEESPGKPILSIRKSLEVYFEQAAKANPNIGKMWKLFRGIHTLFRNEPRFHQIVTVVKRGGLNGLTKEATILPYEAHIDYHQMYAYEMMSKKFPIEKPTLVDGYVKSDYAFYLIKPDVKRYQEYPLLRVKEDGFDVLQSWEELKTMFATRGEYSLADLSGFTSVDLEIILDNYDIIGGNITDFIKATLYWTEDQVIQGRELFADAITPIYQLRKSEDAKKYKTVKGYAKLSNEILSGLFQMQSDYRIKTIVWKGLERTDRTMPTLTQYTSFIGSFITAYGRRDLNWLLHQFKPQQVIGWDTDCVFINDDNVPESVLSRFGEGIGQLHYDGIYKDVFHYKIKHYDGIDIETGEPFMKQSGVSKNGIVYEWNPATKTFDEVNIREKTYNYKVNEDGEIKTYEE